MGFLKRIDFRRLVDFFMSDLENDDLTTVLLAVWSYIQHLLFVSLLIGSIDVRILVGSYKKISKGFCMYTCGLRKMMDYGKNDKTNYAFIVPKNK